MAIAHYGDSGDDPVPAATGNGTKRQAVELPPSGSAGSAGSTKGKQGSGGRSRRPNVVVLLTDDQPDDTFNRSMMPRSYSRIVGEGVDFSRAIAAPPLCCPYRAGLISGRYAHNNGVDRNRPGYAALREPELVLPAFLQKAGYRTGFVGKYLNGTAETLGPEPAPGWDHWYQLQSLAYRGATVSDDGTLVELPSERRTTAALTADAERFIKLSSGRRKPPFFLTVAYYAPHPNRVGRGRCAGNNTAKATARHYRFARRFRLPRNASFGERDVADKPHWVRGLPRLGHEDRLELQRRWRCAIAATQPVDVGVMRILEQLERSGELEKTWVIFGSDNGFNYGEHRLVGKKGFYEQMLQVPLAFRPPGSDRRFDAVRGTGRRELVSEVDVAPTILDIARARPCVAGLGCVTLDGRSLLPLMRARAGSWPAGRGIPLRLGWCGLRGIRTPRHVLIETRRQVAPGLCTTAFVELYDLGADPEQLHNIASKRPRLTRTLRSRARKAQRCSGVKGRDPRTATGWCR